MLDLANFETAAEEGSLLELKDPAGKPLTYDGDKPIKICLAGTQSPRWQKASDALGNKLQDVKEKRTMQDIRADRAAILAKMTIDWEGIVVEGKQIPCTEANAKMLYMRFPWILEQVDKFIGTRENFLPASLSD